MAMQEYNGEFEPVSQQESGFRPQTAQLKKPTEYTGGFTPLNSPGKLEGKGFMSSARDTAKDLGVSVASGVNSLIGAGVAAADMLNNWLGYDDDGNRSKNYLKERGFDPEAWGKKINEAHSDDYKQAQQDFHNAKGLWGKTKVAVSNPFDIVANTVAESAPAMVGGGVLGAGLKSAAARTAGKALIGDAAAAAVGEGAIAGLQNAAQIQQETGGLTADQSLAALGSGALTGAFGMAGGRLANKLGIGDADTALVGALSRNGGQAVGNAGRQGLLGAAVKGALSEGVFEELPQSLQEQVIQNLATDKDWKEGLDEAAVLGVLSGGVMGAGFNVSRAVPEKLQDLAARSAERRARQAEQNAQQAVQPSDVAQPKNGNTALQPQDTPAPAENTTDGRQDTQTEPHTDAAVSGSLKNDIELPAPPAPLDLNAVMSDEWIDTSPPAKPSEVMGLNPDNGVLSAAAAVAVDSGASSVSGGPNHGWHRSTPTSQGNESLTQAADTADLSAPNDQSVIEKMRLARAQAEQVSGGPNDATAPQGGRPLSNAEAAKRFSELNGKSYIDGQRKILSQLGTDIFDARLNEIERTGNFDAADELTRDIQAYARENGFKPVRTGNGIGQFEYRRDNAVSGSLKNDMGLPPSPAPLDLNGEIMDEWTDLSAPAKTASATLQGAANQVDIGGRYENAQWEIREASDLGASMEKAENQFRDRTRQGSQEQIRHMAENLDPRKLGESPVMDYGAPTLARDGSTIIGGNGRTAAIQAAYQNGKGNLYRQSLVHDAGKYGLNPDDVKRFKQPVLVRRLQNDVDIEKAAIASNENGGLQMSSMELAKTDAVRLPDLSAFSFDENGSLNTAANRKAIADFVGAFPVTPRAALQAADGTLSREGLRRLENAMLYRAYGDSPTLARLIDATHQESRNIGNALAQSSSTIAEAKADIQAGVISDLDISQDLMQAADLIEQLRKQGSNVADYLAQYGLFADNLNPVSRRLLGFLDGNVRSAKKIRELVQAYYGQIRSLGNPNQEDIFGNAPRPSREELLEKVINEHEQRETRPQQSDIFGELQRRRNGTDTSASPTGAGTDTAADEAGTQSENSGGNGSGVGEGGRESGSLKDGGIRLSRGSRSNQDAVEAAGKQLERLARYIESEAKYIPNAPIDLGRTPDVLVELGAEQLPLRIVEPKKLFQIVGNRNRKDHGIGSGILAQVPGKLHEPLAVFDSKSEGLVLVLELHDSKGNPIVAAVHLSKKQGYNQVNKVASIYGKDNAQAIFEDWEKEGLLRYLDDRKSRELLTSFGVYFPTEKSNRGLGDNVLLASDIVNRQDQSEQRNHAEIQTALNAALGKDADRIRVAGADEIMPDDAAHLISENIEGWYDHNSDRIVLVADNVSPERAVWVAWHELGHRGVNVAGFADYRATMREAAENRIVRQVARAIQDRRRNTDDAAANDSDVAVEEALVELFAAQQTGNYQGFSDYYGVQIPRALQRGIRGMLARVAERVRAIWARLTGKPAETFSDADVFGLLDVVRNSFSGSLKNDSRSTDTAPTKLSQTDSFIRTEQELGGKAAYERAKENGETELSYRQWVQVRTPEFKAWFGDWENDPDNASKVINPNTGEPLVVYHGTDAEFNVFDRNELGYHTYDNASNLFYGMTAGVGHWFNNQNLNETIDYGKRGVGAFLNIREPRRFDSVSDLAVDIEYSGFIPEDKRNLWDFDDTQEISDLVNEYVANLKDNHDMDGLIVDDEEYGGVSYVAFDSNQIKSATENTGSFDASNDDIRYSRSSGTNVQPNLPAANPPTAAQPVGFVPRMKAVVQALSQAFKDWAVNGAVPFKQRQAQQGAFNDMGELTLGLAAYQGLENLLQPLLAKVKLANGYHENFTHYMRDYRASLNMAGQTAKDLAEQGKSFTEAERLLLSDILEKEVPRNAASPEVLAVADKMRQVLTQQSDDLVALGAISKESADRFRDTYLPRIYNRTNNSGNAALDKLNREFRRAMSGGLGKSINGQHLKGRGIFEIVDKTEQQAWENKGYEMRQDFGNHGRNAGKVLMWRDYTRQERAQMGEIRDAYLRFTSGYVKTQADIAKFALFQRVASDGNLASKAAVDGWVQIPETLIVGTGGVKRYGALSGMWVHPDVAYQLQQQFYVDSAIQKMWRSALGWWKVSKTVYNPVAHMNNVMSNIAMMSVAGGLGNLSRAAKAMKNQDALYREALGVGLVGDAVDTTGVMEMFVGLNGTDGQVMDGFFVNFAKRADKLTFGVIGKIGKKMQTAYQAEDEVFKLALYATARDRGLNPTQAREYATTFMFDYSEVPHGVKVLRDTGILPFVSYVYKAIPAVARLALTKPHKLLALTSLIYGINALSYALLGNAGDEDKEREYMPEYQQGYTAFGTPKLIRMPWNDGNKPVFLDIYRWLPLGDFADTGNRMGGIPLPSAIMPNGPVVGHAAALLMNKDTFSGGNLTEDYMGTGEKAAIYGKWLAAQWLPASVGVPYSYHTNNVLDGVKNSFEGTALSDALEYMGYTGRTYRGEEKDLGRALTGAFGVKVRGDNADSLKGKYERKIGFEIREIRQDMAKIRKDNSLSVPARMAKLRERQNRIAELFRQMQEHRQSAGS